MRNGKLNVAVVGLRFGGCFPPIYQAHPDVGEVTVCDSNPDVLNAYADKYGIARRTARLEDLLGMRDIDAIHLVTPIPLHGSQSLAALNAGKHCACTVPMATTLEELFAIVEAQRRTGLRYMMMETAAYTYQCLYAEELLRNGELGRIQLLRGAHYQDMENWPPYWLGLPPMHYATHAIAPLLKLAGTRAAQVHCFGSGTMRSGLQANYGNPFPAETAIFRLAGGPLVAEVTRSLFETAAGYGELFSVYGDKASVLWQMEGEPLGVMRMAPSEGTLRNPRKTTLERVLPPSYRDRLPEPIRRFDGHQIVPDPTNPHQSVLHGAGHHGSHPHLVHEFVRSIVEDRPSAIDAVTAADWTAAGVCAHASAMQDGAPIAIPAFG